MLQDRKQVGDQHGYRKSGADSPPETAPSGVPRAAACGTPAPRDPFDTFTACNPLSDRRGMPRSAPDPFSLPSLFAPARQTPHPSAHFTVCPPGLRSARPRRGIA